VPSEKVKGAMAYRRVDTFDLLIEGRKYFEKGKETTGRVRKDERQKGILDSTGAKRADFSINCPTRQDTCGVSAR
jgi:hypothetical protein